MNDYRYILEPYKGMNTRYICPECKKPHEFSRYIDAETGEMLADNAGRCNRIDKCGYHYTPKQYFRDNNIDTPKTSHKPIDLTSKKKVSFIPVELFERSLKSYEQNHFVKFLIDLFGDEVTSQLISKYFIGTSKHWDGATIFWQIDAIGKVRTGKIMLYDPTTGHRIKKPNHIDWVHKHIKQPEFELRQCLFGEYLLRDKTKPVAVVESEKTAIISSMYLPQFIWLATGGKSNLNADKFSVLRGRTVTMFPDLNGYDEWKKKVKVFGMPGTKFMFSDLLERSAPENDKREGYDLADYLIKLDWRQFRGHTTQKQPEPVTSFSLVIPLSKTELQFPEFSEAIKKESSWDNDILELERYFAKITLPAAPVKLNTWTTIADTFLFIDSHLAVVKKYNGNRIFLPYLNRLLKLKEIVTINLN